MGRYFFNSFLQTFTVSNPGWGINITEADLITQQTVVLDTNHLNLYFPGLRDKYEPIALANQTYIDTYNFTGLRARVFMEPIFIGNWKSYADKKVMSIDADILMHLNVTLPNE